MQQRGALASRPSGNGRQTGSSWTTSAPDATINTVQESRQVSVPSIAAVRSAGSVRLSMRDYFSTNFLWSALRTSRLVGELETAKGNQPRFDMAHRSYAASSVIASATFLEAAISELFQDASDGHGLRDDGYLAPLASDVVARMAIIWRATEQGRSLKPAEKWQWLLECAGYARLDPGTAPARDALLLVQLRNVLVHFKPEDISAEEEHALTKRLRGKFPDNKLAAGSGNPWWPSHGLGHGCTGWAVRSARTLADHVFTGSGSIRTTAA